ELVDIRQRIAWLPHKLFRWLFVLPADDGNYRTQDEQPGVLRDRRTLLGEGPHAVDALQQRALDGAAAGFFVRPFVINGWQLRRFARFTVFARHEFTPFCR